MAKYGRDKELEELTEQWLRENDPTYNKKNKGYKSEQQMDRKSKQEIPISNLSKTQRRQIEEEYYSNNNNNK